METVKQGRRQSRGGRRRRGVVYVEAVIVLLFFFVLWTSVVYVSRLELARQHARLIARQCAWQIAFAGCDAIPESCARASQERLPEEARLEDEFRPAESEVTSGAARDPYDIGTNARDLVASKVSGLLFQRIVARGYGTARRTPPYGGGLVRVEAAHALPCNSRPRTLGEYARRFFDALFD